MSRGSILTFVGGLVLGVVASFAATGAASVITDDVEDGAEAAAEPEARAFAPIRGASSPRHACAAATAADVRAIVREELRSGGAVEAVDAPEGLERAGERDAAFDEATTRVAAAMSRGEWTDDDARYLSERLGAMRAQDRDTVLATLLPALNDGAIAARFSTTPF